MKKLFFSLLTHEYAIRPLQYFWYKILNLSDFKLSQDIKHILRKVRKNTMVDYPRIRQLAELAQLAESNELPGAFVECGVWRGGCSALMAYIADKNAKENNTKVRDIFMFDSFEGLPKATHHDGEPARLFSKSDDSGELTPVGKNVASEEEVKKLFKDLKLDGSNVHIIKGWFQDTLPLNKNKVGRIAILRLDGDWYESTRVCLESLYDNVVSGGYVILDDYHFWDGCRKATDEFIAKRNLKVSIINHGISGVYFIKP